MEKKIFLFVNLFILCFSFVTNYCIAQWMQSNGPYGGNITSFAINGSNIIAGTNGNGVFLSTNNGTSWNPVNNGLISKDIQSLAVSGNNVFAGTGLKLL
jgi:hypothetical protein